MSTPLSDMLLAVGINQSTIARLELAGGGAVHFDKTNRGYFHLVLSGSVTIRCEGREVHLREGDYAALVRGTAHRLDTGDAKALPQRNIILEGRDRIAPPMRLGKGKARANVITGLYGIDYPGRTRASFSIPDPLVLRGRTEAGERQLGGLVSLSVIAHDFEGGGAKALLASLIQFLHIRMLLVHMADIVTPQNATPRAMGLMELDSVVSLLRNRSETHWTLASLAREVGMSRSALAERFSAATGESPMGYLKRVRMDKAAEMLARTDEPMSQISLASGYASQAAFSRAFRRQFKMSPSAYRRARMRSC